MEDFKVKVPGVDFELASNQIYYIREISDPNAPDGYQMAGISKHPLPGIDESISVPYHSLTKTWNTGFFEGSACIRKEGQNGKKILKTVKDKLLPHLELLVEGDLTNGKSSNNEFFDSFPPFDPSYGQDVTKYRIKGNNQFNTKNPLEFLALWWALIGKKIIPESEKYSSDCRFVIENKKQTTNIAQDEGYEESQAEFTVMSVLKSKNKKELSHLQDVLLYSGLSLEVESMDEKPLISTFKRWIKQGEYGNKNAAKFNEDWDKFEEDESRNELFAYVKLLADIKSSKVNVERGDIIVEGVNLGPDKKLAAKKLTLDQELYKTFLSI